MEDLIAFYRARLDEDEAAARAVIRMVGPERVGDPFTDGSGIAEIDSYPSYPHGQHAEELAFMAGPGHPDRVLADIAAKRAILDEHATEWPDSEFTYCRVCRDRVRHDAADAPCRTVRLLVQPFAGHPDFRPEWRLAAP